MQCFERICLFFFAAAEVLLKQSAFLAADFVVNGEVILEQEAAVTYKTHFAYQPEFLADGIDCYAPERPYGVQYRLSFVRGRKYDRGADEAVTVGHVGTVAVCTAYDGVAVTAGFVFIIAYGLVSVLLEIAFPAQHFKSIKEAVVDQKVLEIVRIVESVVDPGGMRPDRQASRLAYLVKGPFDARRGHLVQAFWNVELIHRFPDHGFVLFLVHNGRADTVNGPFHRLQRSVGHVGPFYDGVDRILSARVDDVRVDELVKRFGEVYFFSGQHGQLGGQLFKVAQRSQGRIVPPVICHDYKIVTPAAVIRAYCLRFLTAVRAATVHVKVAYKRICSYQIVFHTVYAEAFHCVGAFMVDILDIDKVFLLFGESMGQAQRAVAVAFDINADVL